VDEGAEVELVRETHRRVTAAAVDALQQPLQEPTPPNRQEEATSESADSVGVEILPALTEEHAGEESKHTFCARPVSPVSRSTSSASVELEGSLHEKPSPRCKCWVPLFVISCLRAVAIMLMNRTLRLQCLA
jgi:hypothetical protein